jgi:fructokinase
VILPGPAAGRRTSSAEVTIDADGGPAYRFDVDWTLETTALDVGDPTHVHFGSIGAYLVPGAETVREIVGRSAATATVSFDPNIRAQFLPDHSAAVAATEGHVAASDLVKASDEDLAWLYPGAPLEVVAQRWLALGPGVVIITRGGEGATLVTAAGETTLPAHVVTVVDSIGAGDAFMSGLIAGIHSRGLVGPTGRAALRTIEPSVARELVELAMLCGAITVRRAGAQPPRRDELPASLL